MKMSKEDLQPQNVTEMEWTVHLIKRNWIVSTAVILFLIILCSAIYLSFGSATFIFLSAAILFISLVPFFFPTTYTFQDDCVIVKSLLRKSSRRWDYFKSYYPDRNGVLLSPFPSPSRLENFRGLYIKFEHNRSEVVDFIEKKLKKVEGQ
jgi:hypothetical protein